MASIWGSINLFIMENFGDVLSGVPGELLMIVSGVVVAILTQVAKKIRDRFGYEIDPKVIAALLAIVGGIIYAIFVNVAPDEWMEKVTQFGALAFSGAVAIYELYKSLIKKPIDASDKSFSDNEVKLKDGSLLFALIEKERQARMLKIEFEPFSLNWIKIGKRTEDDLRGHIFSLQARIDQEVKKYGDANPLVESGI